jgi:hypothetical protein
MIQSISEIEASIAARNRLRDLESLTQNDAIRGAIGEVRKIQVALNGSGPIRDRYDTAMGTMGRLMNHIEYAAKNGKRDVSRRSARVLAAAYEGYAEIGRQELEAEGIVEGTYEREFAVWKEQMAKGLLRSGLCPSPEDPFWSVKHYARNASALREKYNL